MSPALLILQLVVPLLNQESKIMMNVFCGTNSYYYRTFQNYEPLTVHIHKRKFSKTLIGQSECIDYRIIKNSIYHVLQILQA